ncbi:MAG: aldose epimerase family protein [Vicinamibacteria bacterium]
MRSLLVGTAVLAFAPLAAGAAPTKAGTVRSSFGKTAKGEEVALYTLTNAHGMEVRTIARGATIVSIRVPDRAGKLGDVTLGFDTLAGYEGDANPFLGNVVGRYANRIGGAAFTLDGKEYKLAANNAPNHLHGGPRGFDKYVWAGKEVARDGAVGVEWTMTSPDGDEGYPGTLKATVTYLLTPKDELVVEYLATTDKPTVVNLTQHAYFNLGGEGSGNVLDHVLQIHASRYTPVAPGLIPTGELAPVAGTPLDFTKPERIGARIESDHPQMKLGSGYDHNGVLDRKGEGLVHAAHVVEPKSGRVMDVHTTEPGLQIYTANFLDSVGKGGHRYGRRDAVCFETQHYPDSPNKKDFPSTVLRPGETYRSKTVFAFSVQK